MPREATILRALLWVNEDDLKPLDCCEIGKWLLLRHIFVALQHFPSIRRTAHVGSVD